MEWMSFSFWCVEWARFRYGFSISSFILNIISLVLESQFGKWSIFSHLNSTLKLIFIFTFSRKFSLFRVVKKRYSSHFSNPEASENVINTFCIFAQSFFHGDLFNFVKYIFIWMAKWMKMNFSQKSSWKKIFSTLLKTINNGKKQQRRMSTKKKQNQNHKNLVKNYHYTIKLCSTPSVICAVCLCFCEMWRAKKKISLVYSRGKSISVKFHSKSTQMFNSLFFGSHTHRMRQRDS